MPTIYPTLIPTVEVEELFERLVNDTSLSVRWITKQDPVMFEVANRPSADIAVRQLIIAKALSEIKQNQVSITENDTGTGFLFDKVEAGDHIELSVINPGGDETLRIDSPLPERLETTARLIINWNNALENGWYKGEDAANAPGVGWYIGNVEAHDPQWVTQTVHAFMIDSVTNTQCWRRSRNNGTWESWYRVRMSEAEQIVASSRVRVSNFDTTPEFLMSKLVAGENVEFTIDNPGGVEKVRIDIPLHGVGGKVSQVGHGFTVGTPIRFSESQNKYVGALADTVKNSESIGIVTEVDGDNFTYQLAGPVSTLSGLIPGRVYFLNSSTSALTLSEPPAPFISKPMLVSTSATEGIILHYRGTIGAGDDDDGFRLKYQLFTDLPVSTTTINLNFQYTLNKNSILVFRNGVLQVSGVDYNETNINSITLIKPIESTDEEIVVYRLFQTHYHTTDGVESINVSGEAELTGDVTLTGSGDAVLSQVGNNINIHVASTPPPPPPPPSGLEIGSIILWHLFSSAPSGYLKCNGAAVSRTIYADLFSIIGTNYGAGDGSTTFNLPSIDPQGGGMGDWNFQDVTPSPLYGCSQLNSIPNNDILASDYGYTPGYAGGQLLKRIGGTGNFTQMSVPQAYGYNGICGHTIRHNELYHCTSYGGIIDSLRGSLGIWMSSNGGSSWTSVGPGGNHGWTNMCCAPNGDVYCCAYSSTANTPHYGARVIVRPGGVGGWVDVSGWSGNPNAICAAPNGDIYLASSGGDIFIRPGGTGNFTPLGQTSRYWAALTAAQNGDIYAGTSNQGVFVRIGGSGNFVPVAGAGFSHNAVSMTASYNGNLYISSNRTSILMSPIPAVQPGNSRYIIKY